MSETFGNLGCKAIDFQKIQCVDNWRNDRNVACYELVLFRFLLIRDCIKIIMDVLNKSCSPISLIISGVFVVVVLILIVDSKRILC